MMSQDQNKSAGYLLTETILERGQRALVASLGEAGAMEFLRAVSATADDGQRRLLTSFDIDPARNEVVLKFSRATGTVRLSPEEAKEYATEIYGRATVLGRMQSA